MTHESMREYFNLLTKHIDPQVRNAASICLEAYDTPRWRSITMRRMLADLSWALRDYGIKDGMDKKPRR